MSFLITSRRAGLILLFACLAGAAAAQSPDAAAPGGDTPAGAWTAPRTPWGDPDLQGLWTNRTTTPLQRPAHLAHRETLTDIEAAIVDEEVTSRNDRAPAPGNPGTYNQFWWEMGSTVSGNRTSLIVDPPDGRVPPLTPKAVEAILASRAGRGPADSWEDRTLFERCITRGLPGAMIPGFYNHNYQIVQTPGQVAILIEMIHDVRIIPVDGRPHLHPAIRQWMGDSRGRWEGDTLVVETTNFSPKSRSHGFFESAGTLRLVERFTRVAPDTIDYRFTVDDPETYTRPWTAVIPMHRTDERIFEFACHEGNESIPGILGGHRAAEAEAEKEKVKP
ncbi:MAG: hypothetical protein FJW23_08615 [Acidimicrobiia bacterium]|nr:hypothetical protein [Acidimicrobiia bacterium]